MGRGEEVAFARRRFGRQHSGLVPWSFRGLLRGVVFYDGVGLAG